MTETETMGTTSADTTSENATDPGTTGATTTESCGNGVKDPGEECDGNDFGGQTCSDYDHIGGSLSCDADCTVSTSSCGPACGGVGDSCFVETDCCPGLTCDEWFGCQ